jgi:hypothetical protein
VPASTIVFCQSVYAHFYTFPIHLYPFRFRRPFSPILVSLGGYSVINLQCKKRFCSFRLCVQLSR